MMAGMRQSLSRLQQRSDGIVSMKMQHDHNNSGTREAQTLPVSQAQVESILPSSNLDGSSQSSLSSQTRGMNHSGLVPLLPASPLPGAASNSDSFIMMTHQRLYDRDAPEDKEKSNKPRKILFMPCDAHKLSDYQCLVRKQIEVFEATQDDIEAIAQGRNRPIVLGQVGIRCIHCSKIPPRQRTKGATYYPTKLVGLYQAAQNMASWHFCECCPLISDALRLEFIVLRERKSTAGGGKHYWGDAVRALGVVEDGDILRFAKSEKEEGEGERN
jgi:hypothetical protein